MKEILLKNKNLICLVDDEDYEKISAFNWLAHKSKNNNTYYARVTINKNGKRFMASMHRVLLGIEDSQIEVDHINGQGLDNRKENLRVVTRQQNNLNTGLRKDNRVGFKGVSRNSYGVGFRARIAYMGKDIYLGIFDTAKEASDAYEMKAKELFGEFYRSPEKR